MEKLFKTKAMREIHYVNGEFDIIAKIVMQSDLFEFDAAVIGEFVHERIRSISAVTRTQTIVPAHSKRKKGNDLIGNNVTSQVSCFFGASSLIKISRSKSFMKYSQKSAENINTFLGFFANPLI
ncbi:Lrp/AsnC ligand binding domain-containing protein [Desulfococcaceae bacterium HSG7]|nr:Lrp/AsnC ligand binding domain-containing protein [Desulfococcaceae bacterium HSG7]